MLTDTLYYNYHEPAVEYDLWDKPKTGEEKVDYSNWCETPDDRRLAPCKALGNIGKPIAKRVHQPQWDTLKYFLWDKKRSKIADQITIPQTIKVELNEVKNDKNIVSLTMRGQPLASLNGPEVEGAQVTDRFNKGPYIDIMSYSLKPLSEGPFVSFDSSGGTTVKTFREVQQQNQSLGINFSAVMGHHGLQPVTNIGSGLNASMSSGSSVETEQLEFKQKVYSRGDQGEKRVLIFFLNKCYYENSPLPYDVNKISTLQKNTNQFGTGYWRELNTPPDAATSSFNADWKMQYEFPKNLVGPVRFESTTEVRTVVGSSNRICRKECIAESLSWIKTVHQINTVFKINIDENQQKASIELESINTKRICSHGFSYFSREKIDTEETILVEGSGKNKTKSPLTENEALGKCNIWKV